MNWFSYTSQQKIYGNICDVNILLTSHCTFSKHTWPSWLAGSVSRAGVSKLLNVRASLYISHIYAGEGEKRKKQINANNLISSNIQVKDMEKLKHIFFKKCKLNRFNRNYKVIISFSV